MIAHPLKQKQLFVVIQVTTMEQKMH